VISEPRRPQCHAQSPRGAGAAFCLWFMCKVPRRRPTEQPCTAASAPRSRT
jgi:hypothetical protein